MSETDPDHDTAFCKHCRRPIWQRVNPEPGEWAHYPGGIYCQTHNGFTASPLRVATPMSHPKEGFDEDDYEGSYGALGKTVFGPASVTRESVVFWACKRCATLTTDRGIHDQCCPAKKELR